MKFDLTLGVTDKPGQLVRALEPIAKNGGNVISIIHEREKPAEGYVPVSLVVDFPSKQNLGKTIADLRASGISIIKSEEIVERTRLTMILIGKMDLRRLVETRLENVRITEFEVSAPTSDKACVKMNLEVPTESVDKVLDELKRISKEEKALLISSV